ncbi:hypothetical protein Egran_00346, partial [Elaphomyces granulatus]
LRFCYKLFACHSIPFQDPLNKSSLSSDRVVFGIASSVNYPPRFQLAGECKLPAAVRRTTMGKLTSTIGIPIKLLNEAQGHVVTLEITSGQVYRGKLLEAEDNMNVQLKDITVTARDGRVSHLDQVYIRGSHVRFFIVPDMLRCVPRLLFTGNQNPAFVLAPFRMAVSNMCPIAEMHQCSGPEANVEEGLVWRAVRLQLTGPGGREGVEAIW